MSNDMKCPFCQQELVEIQFGEQRYWSCINDKCNESVGFGGNLKIWQELIRTRKALDVAVDALKMIGSGDIIEHSVVGHEDDNKIFIAKKALEQITALEQKD